MIGTKAKNSGFYPYLTLIVSVCLLSIPYISDTTYAQPTYIFKKVSTVPQIYSGNITMEKNQIIVPSNNSTLKDNITQNDSMLFIEKIDEVTNAIKNSTTSLLNASISNTQLIQKVDESLDSLEQIKKSIDESSWYATIGLIAGLASIALSLGIPYAYDNLKRPDLLIEAGTITDFVSPYVYVHGKVINKPHAGWRYIDPSILRSVLEDVRNLTFNLLLYADSYKTVAELQEKIFPIRREVFEKTEKSNLCLDL